MKRLRNKADRLLQEHIRKNYTKCEYCSNQSQVGHHFVPKSVCSNLRYDLANVIPLCHGCHMKHHNGDPMIHAYIVKKRGDTWFKYIARNRKIVKVNKGFYKEAIKQLE